jgi:hypothetical protein
MAYRLHQMRKVRRLREERTERILGAFAGRGSTVGVQKPAGKVWMRCGVNGSLDEDALAQGEQPQPNIL